MKSSDKKKINTLLVSHHRMIKMLLKNTVYSFFFIMVIRTDRTTRTDRRDRADKSEKTDRTDRPDI